MTYHSDTDKAQQFKKDLLFLLILGAETINTVGTIAEKAKAHLHEQNKSSSSL